MRSQNSSIAQRQIRKSRWRRRTWAGGCFFALIIVASLLYIATRLLVPKELMRMSESAVQYSKAHPEAFSIADNKVLLVSNGPDDAEITLIFVHGSPGDWSANLLYLDAPRLVERHRIIAPDRPGYGMTAVDAGGISMSAQANRLVRALDKVKGRKIWIGHSFGASIAARVAMDHPDEIDALVLVAGAMAADYERKRWYHQIGDWRLSRRVLPSSMDMANQEAIAFESEFKEMTGLWRKIRCPVVIIHGREDSLADYRHVAYTIEHLSAPARVVTLENEGHFIYWSHSEVVIDEVLKLVEGFP